MQETKMQNISMRFMFECPNPDCMKLNVVVRHHLPIIDKYGEEQALFYYCLHCEYCKTEVNVTKDLIANMQFDRD